MAERYITEKGFCYVNRNAVWVLVRDIKRYQGFVRSTDEKRKGFVFDVDRIKSEDLEDFVSYLRNEKRLSKEYPQVFSRLLRSYPAGVRKGRSSIEERGDNTIVKLQRNLKSFFGWLNEKQITSNRPFEGFEIGSEHYGDPYYITVAERNRIADYDFAVCERLETQRDIFVFQCLVGCRVSDLMRLTSKNVVDGVLVYVPHKTKDETGIEARVPLLPKAKELISKYKGVDKKGRLFPFISPQNYNSSIKEIFTEVGIVRSVAVRNSKTGEVEMKPINTVASSHMARRTFVGNAYLHVKDHKAGIEGIRLVIVQAAPLLHGQLVMALVIIVVAQHRDLILAVRDEVFHQGRLSAGAAACNADDQNIVISHGFLPPFDFSPPKAARKAAGFPASFGCSL